MLLPCNMNTFKMQKHGVRKTISKWMGTKPREDAFQKSYSSSENHLFHWRKGEKEKVDYSLFTEKKSTYIIQNLKREQCSGTRNKKQKVVEAGENQE